ncbi:hypothetical protein CJI97_005632 [Candidozyma auris]|nr:hypothetical protein CJI97_005632 [[Candida] auris]
MVGHGSFGVVFQTQLLPSNEIAAIKQVLQDKRFKNRELQIMKLVHHRNVVDLRYYFYTNNDKNELFLNLILEFVPETLYKHRITIIDLGATNYTTKIDVWSAGCVMAELIFGQPLFPGESGVDQLVEIIKILGTPTREQIKNMNPNYTEYKFPSIKPVPLSKIFRKNSADCVQFIMKILEYSPIDRISCIEALADPYFDELREESTKLPNYRKLFSQQIYSNSTHYPHQNNATYQLYSNQPDVRELPELFDFDDRELSVEPSLNSVLVPKHALNRLRITRGNSLDSFVPMTPEEMEVTLE